MKKTSPTSIIFNEKRKLISDLDSLLSNLQIFYAKLQCFCDNVRPNEIHPFKQIYARMKDVGAEEIHKVLLRTIDLGGMPALNFNNELNNSKNKQVEVSRDGAEAAKLAVNYLDNLIKLESDIQITALEKNDKVTSSLMNSLIKEQERGLNILLLFLQKESNDSVPHYLEKNFAVSC